MQAQAHVQARTRAHTHTHYAPMWCKNAWIQTELISISSGKWTRDRTALGEGTKVDFNFVYNVLPLVDVSCRS